METRKSRVFTKKLVALFLSVLMALSCFTGAITAFGASVASDKDYSDSNLAANFMTWAETTDEQTAEALLDYADLYIGDLLSGLLGTDHLYFSQNVVVATIKIDGYLDSVDGLYDIIRQANGILSSFGGIVGGDVKNIDLSPIASLPTVTSGESVVSKCGKSYRGANSAKEMIMALAKTLYVNTNDFAGKNVIGQFFKGSLSLGIVENFIGGNIYSLLQGALGMWNGYQSDIVYNIVANLILQNTKWFDEATKADYYAQLQSGNRTTFVFDDILFDALNRELLQKISVLVTYPTFLEDGTNESSYTRNKDGKANPKLVYSPEFVDENGVEMNVFLFQYDFDGDGAISDDEKLSIKQDDTLFSFAFRALKFAWYTVLEDTLGLVHVNYDVDRGHGANFDNQYFYWINGSKDYEWDTKNWKSNYTADKVEAWANAVYADYGAASAEEFLANVKHTFDYDRNVPEDAHNNWRDLDATRLFAELRYNPLADLYFDIQTGPINLYFMQTGIDPISEFFNTAFTTYDNMVAGFNDMLVAATDILFLDSDNIGYGSDGAQDSRKPAAALTAPTMVKTGNTIDKEVIATTLVNNFMAMFEYAANAADVNILAPYYAKHNISNPAGNLSEANMEEAMIPLLVACINQIGMTKPIHDEKWDSCVDAEGVAIVALEEYLSFVLPDKDYTPLWTYNEDGALVANPGQDLFTNAVLPMARDAVSYLVQSVVPCRDANGNPWNVYERAVNDPTTIFEILNSVVVYYVSTDGYGSATTNSNGVKLNNEGKAVGALLGAVNSEGYNLVSRNNDLWENIDAIANKLLPILGAFQYGTKAMEGQFSSKDFIWNDLVVGILDIDKDHTADMYKNGAYATGKKGITNIIEKFITIITSDPISNNYGSGSLTVMIYDVLAQEINTIFGARYNGQGYKMIIPYSAWYDKDTSTKTKSSAPFDSLLTVDTFGNYSVTGDIDNATDDKQATGILGVLICDIYEIFGGNAGGSYRTYANNGKIWTGAMFAVEAVNNFIPSFVPQIADHSFYAATAKVADASRNGLTAGNAFGATTLDITNNSKGLNRFYKDANGEVAQFGRYFIDVTSITVKDTKGNAVSGINVGSFGTIAPGKTAKVQITGNTPATGTTYAFEITYDVYQAKTGEDKTPANTKFTDLKTTAYMFVTPEKDWQATVYPSDRYSSDWGVTMFPKSMEYDKKNQRGEYTHSTENANNLIATLPNEFIVKMSNPSEISNNGILVRNTHFASARAFDGVITYIKAGTQYYPVSNGVISDTLTSQASDNNDVGYAAIDKATGDILNYEFYDYSLDGGKTYVRKDTDGWTYGKHGYTADEINTIKDANPNAEFVTRPHVVLTLQEALNSGLVYGVKRTPAATDENGNLTYVYDAVLINLQSSAANVKPSGSDETVNTLLLKGNGSQDSISWGTPTPGLYLAAHKISIKKSSNAYSKFIVYDGTTELSATDYEMNVCVWRTSNNIMNGQIHMYICDDAAANSLNNSYRAATKDVSTYMASDMDDVVDNESGVYTSMQNALANAVSVMGTPIRPDNAGNIGSNTEKTAKYYQAINRLHKDVAYKPIPTSTALAAKVMVDAVKGADGYWYANKECTLPIYSSVELTDADVTNGKNAVGETVAKGEDGKYHLVNAPVYEIAWDIGTYSAPYRYETNVQATDGTNPLYKEINFVYRDVNGDKCNSGDEWAYKLAEQQTTIVPNVSSENRGVFQQANDNIEYHLEQLRKHVNSKFADTIGKGVSEDRQGMNNVNYEIASYEKMVQIAKHAEKLITTTYEEILGEDGTPVLDENGNKTYNAIYSTDRSSLEIQVAYDLYNTYKDMVITRPYMVDGQVSTGKKLEEEIVCASGLTYDQISVNEKGDILVPSAKYGAVENGVLVNDGYTEESWNYYTWALGNAATLAQNAHDGVAEANTKVSNLYTVRTDLMRAENGLTVEPAPQELTISGKVTIAEDVEGKNGSIGVVGIEVQLTDGTVLGTSAEDGSFSVAVPIGTTELVISGPTTIDRTVTISGANSIENANIPMVIVDYSGDKKVINSIDAGLFCGYMEGDYYVYADLNGAGGVNAVDAGLFCGFLNFTSYSALALD